MPHQTIKQEMARVRKEVAIAAAIIGILLIAAVLATGWIGDHRSCLRSVDIRRALIDQRTINKQAIPFWRDRGENVIAARLERRVKADSRIQQLDCSRLIPGT